MSPGFPTDNPAVQPIPLRNKTARDGIKCIESGWGHLGEKEKHAPHNLQYVILHFVPYEICRSKFDNAQKSIQPGMICANYFEKEADACYVSNNFFFTYLLVIGNEIIIHILIQDLDTVILYSTVV